MKKLNGSSWSAFPGSTEQPPERLVEAELHLFKLKPHFSASLLVPSHPTRGDGFEPAFGSTDDVHRKGALWSHSAGPPKLRTNLLEVSLYQVLPSQQGQQQPQFGPTFAADQKGEHKQKEPGNVSKGPNKDAHKDQLDDNNNNNNHQPLRLLDIRRMDLYASGWETFYVKRAVNDWIRDPSSNLGLVIKAKSMFEEPIKIGLIRFADLYDQPSFSQPAHGRETRIRNGQRSRENGTENGTGTGTGTENSSEWLASGQPLREQRARSWIEMSSSSLEEQVVERQANRTGPLEGHEQQTHELVGEERQAAASERDERVEFNLSHQPILVIYTTTIPEPRASGGAGAGGALGNSSLPIDDKARLAS